MFSGIFIIYLEMDKIEKKRLYDIEYRKKNKDKIKKQQFKDYSARKKRFTADPAKYLHSVAKVRAKKYNIPFDIEVEDIEIPLNCPIGGNLLVKGDGYNPDAMSLDKLNPSKGYVKGNVFVISRKWNLKKSDMSIEDMNKIINYIKSKLCVQI